MGKKNCKACGCEGVLTSLIINSIIPEDVTKQAGIVSSRTATLCRKCSEELQNWYSKRVFNIVYDPGSKQFKPQSPTRMVKEYEGAYEGFIKYKKRPGSKDETSHS